MKNNRRGISLLSVSVAGAIIALALVYFVRSQDKSSRGERLVQEELIAELYATELLEFLRSHRDERLREFLENNPYEGDVTGPTCAGGSADPRCLGYYICSQVNILDRTNSQLINRHDFAALPANNPLNRGVANLNANRWFQVQVIDLANPLGGGPPPRGTVAINKTHCADRFSDINFSGGAGHELEESEKFLITVGVSWIPKSIENPDINTDVKRVVLSTIIPSKHD